MNNTLLIAILVLFLSCKKKENPFGNTTKKVDSEVFYDIKWSKKSLNSNSQEMFEMYISSKGDTIYNQKKIFKEGELDTIESNFYNLQVNRNHSRMQGVIYVKSTLNKKIKNPISEKNLWLYLVKYEEGKMDIIEFRSQNTDTVSFDFKSNKELVMGMVKEQITVDTIINGKKMIRLLESVIIIDSQEKTKNPLIEALKEGA